MICPKCEMEYIDGVKVCDDCNTKLIPVEEFEGNLVHHSDWVVAYTTDERYEAEMYKANLESAGIETNVLGQKDLSFPMPGDLSVIKLLIKKSDVDAALSIFNDIAERAGEDSE